MKYPALIAVLASLAVFLDVGGHLDSFERQTLDARYRFFALPARHTHDIVILHVSEESIKRLEPFYGRWPWPRVVHAEAIEYLESDGASAIGFDILFPEKSLRQEVDSAIIDQLKALAKNADLPEVRAELQHRLDALNPELSDALFVSQVGKSRNVFCRPCSMWERMIWRRSEVLRLMRMWPRGSSQFWRIRLCPFN